MSWRRPSNRPSRLTRPAGPSNQYSLSTASQGILLRSAASASRARVSSFSLTRSSSRAARHSSGETISGVFIQSPSFVVRTLGPSPILTVGRPRTHRTRLASSVIDDTNRSQDWAARRRRMTRTSHRATAAALRPDDSPAGRPSSLSAELSHLGGLGGGLGGVAYVAGPEVLGEDHGGAAAELGVRDL